MILAMNREDPVVREAMDQAARVAEWLLEAYNSDYSKELALDVLAAWVDDIDQHLFGGRHCGDLRDPRKRLAWALILTERRTDLKPHEQRLLDDAWEHVLELERQREWEEMGL